jgi:hypothetical protein
MEARKGKTQSLHLISPRMKKSYFAQVASRQGYRLGYVFERNKKNQEIKKKLRKLEDQNLAKNIYFAPSYYIDTSQHQC